METKNVSRIACFAVILTGACFLSGCSIYYNAPTRPYIAGVFSDVSAPMDITFRETKIGPSQGKSKSTSIASLFAFGDASIGAAAREGNLVEVTHADYQYTNVLGIYTQFQTIAWGYRDEDLYTGTN